MRALTALPLLLVACGGGSYGDGTINGAIGDVTFGDELTLYHGTRFLLFMDRKVDCIDVNFVERSYFSGTAASETAFAGIQLTFEEEAPFVQNERGVVPAVGTFPFQEGDGAVDGWVLVNTDLPEGQPPPLEYDTIQEGTLTIDSAGPDIDDPVSGSFDVVFREGNAGGTFTTVHCRNVQDV